jgi:hypothetical protein
MCLNKSKIASMNCDKQLERAILKNDITAYEKLLDSGCIARRSDLTEALFDDTMGDFVELILNHPNKPQIDLNYLNSIKINKKYDKAYIIDRYPNIKDEIAKQQMQKQEYEKRRLEKERLEKERLEKERLEKERLEKERLEKERLEKERLEKERLEKGQYATIFYSKIDNFDAFITNNDRQGIENAIKEDKNDKKIIFEYIDLLIINPNTNFDIIDFARNFMNDDDANLILNRASHNNKIELFKNMLDHGYKINYETLTNNDVKYEYFFDIISPYLDDLSKRDPDVIPQFYKYAKERFKNFRYVRVNDRYHIMNPMKYMINVCIHYQLPWDESFDFYIDNKTYSRKMFEYEASKYMNDDIVKNVLTGYYDASSPKIDETQIKDTQKHPLSINRLAKKPPDYEDYVDSYYEDRMQFSFNKIRQSNGNELFCVIS